MKNVNVLSETDNEKSLTIMAKTLKEKCANCNPMTPIACVIGCRTWKLKSQFRSLYGKTRSPDFMIRLLNTLKNRRRVRLLRTICGARVSIDRLQKSLEKEGYNHSCKTIVGEYLKPLLEVGLAEEEQSTYYSTFFAQRLNEIASSVQEFEDVLSPHSKCYEEIVLASLMSGAKTYKNLESIVPSKSLGRVLGRLHNASLIMKGKEKAYVFFFRTKRNPENSKMSATENRVYENIPRNGIPAQKLANAAGISTRRTYKYIRKLKGKKLVFARKEHLTYTLTAKGAQTAETLKAIRDLAIEASTAAEWFVKEDQTHEKLTDSTKKNKKVEETLPTEIRTLGHQMPVTKAHAKTKLS